jgi:hypothetical protein
MGGASALLVERQELLADRLDHLAGRLAATCVERTGHAVDRAAADMGEGVGQETALVPEVVLNEANRDPGTSWPCCRRTMATP